MRIGHYQQRIPIFHRKQNHTELSTLLFKHRFHWVIGNLLFSPSQHLKATRSPKGPTTHSTPWPALLASSLFHPPGQPQNTRGKWIRAQGRRSHSFGDKIGLLRIILLLVLNSEEDRWFKALQRYVQRQNMQRQDKWKRSSATTNGRDREWSTQLNEAQSTRRTTTPQQQQAGWALVLTFTLKVQVSL